jgi:hypothetical protein
MEPRWRGAPTSSSFSGDGRRRHAPRWWLIDLVALTALILGWLWPVFPPSARPLNGQPFSPLTASHSEDSSLTALFSLMAWLVEWNACQSTSGSTRSCSAHHSPRDGCRAGGRLMEGWSGGICTRTLLSLARRGFSIHWRPKQEGMKRGWRWIQGVQGGWEQRGGGQGSGGQWRRVWPHGLPSKPANGRVP